MAKGSEGKKTNAMVDKQLATQNQAFGNYNKTMETRGNEAYGKSNQLWDELHSGYGALAGGQMPGGGGFAGGGGGWALPGTYEEAKNEYRKFIESGGIDADKIRGAGHSTMEEISKTGGFDDPTKARITGDIDAMRQYGATGGIDAAAQARMRGGGVFDEFARTGGVSEAEARNLRARGNATLSSAFGANTAAMNRAARIGGGSPMAMQAMAAQQGRLLGREAGAMARDTELGISDRVRQGRQWGGEGMSQSEAELQRQLAGNRKWGMEGALGGEMGLADTIARNRLSGAGMWNQSEMGIQELGQKGKMFGTSGLESVAGAEAQHAASNAAAAASAGRYSDAMRLEGLEGLSRLRGQNPGEVAEYNSNLLSGIGGQANAAAGLTAQRYGAATNNRSAWDTATGLLGAGAGIAGGLMTGGASKGIAALPGAMDPRKLNAGWY